MSIPPYAQPINPNVHGPLIGVDVYGRPIAPGPGGAFNPPVPGAQPLYQPGPGGVYPIGGHPPHGGIGGPMGGAPIGAPLGPHFGAVGGPIGGCTIGGPGAPHGQFCGGFH